LNDKLWLALLAASSASPALAQTGNLPESFGASARSDGGGSVLRRLGVRADLNASYDSNVLGVSKAARRANVIEDSVDDFRITPSLALDLITPFGRQSAFLRGEIGYDFYFSNTHLNRERINLNGGANLRAGGTCSALVDAAYARQRSNSANVFAVTADPLIDENNTEETISYGGQAQCGGPIGISPSFGYRHTRVRNSSPFFIFNDSNQDAFNASLGYQRPTLGRISVYGNYSEGEYIRRNILGLPAGSIPGLPLDGVKNYSAGVRFERSIGSRIYGAVALGYSWADPRSPLSRKFRGTSYAVNLGVRPSDRLTVDLNASRASELSNAVFATFAVTEQYGVNGTYRLNQKLAFNFGSSYQKRDYQGDARVIDDQAQVSKDEFVRGYVGFVYDLNRRLRMNGVFSQQRRMSDNSFFNYNNSTASLGVSLSLGR
jgi:hypothetical protein